MGNSGFQTFFRLLHLCLPNLILSVSKNFSFQCFWCPLFPHTSSSYFNDEIIYLQGRFKKKKECDEINYIIFILTYKHKSNLLYTFHFRDLLMYARNYIIIYASDILDGSWNTEAVSKYPVYLQYNFVVFLCLKSPDINGTYH